MKTKWMFKRELNFPSVELYSEFNLNLYDAERIFRETALRTVISS